MMHVSVMMLSYSTLLVGSLSCMAFLLVDASQGWEGSKSTLGFLDGLFGNGDGKTTSEGEGEDRITEVVGAAPVELGDGGGEAAAAAVMAVRPRSRPKVLSEGASAGVEAGTRWAATSSDAALAAEFPPVDSGDRLLKEMDNLSYRCLGAGFALLTAGLISGRGLHSFTFSST
jgi:ABC-type transport system involved in cytochrome c biogenesis permease subunit